MDSHNKLVSLCMIVKNEEQLLQRCLDSIKDLADEVIIIDTGSTDRTKEIALQNNALIYDFKWINDFSAARNESIRYATGKWILWMDADEYMDQSDAAGIRRFLEQLDSTGPIGLITPIINYTGDNGTEESIESSSIRFFSNHPDLNFENPIHEQVVAKKNDITYLQLPFYIYHTGYTKSVREEKDKSSRNLAIFESLAKTRKLSGYEQYTLGNEYMVKKNYKKALYYYQRAISQIKTMNTWMVHCVIQMIHANLNLERFKDAYDLIEKYLSHWGKYPDLYTYKGIIFTYFGFYDLAITEFERAIGLAEKSKTSRFWLISPNLGSTIPYSKLAGIYSELLDKPKTIYFLTKLVQTNPSDQVSLYKLIELLLQSEEPSAIISFLNKMFSNQDPKDIQRLFQVCLMSGNKTMAEYYYDLCLNRNLELTANLLVQYSLIIQDREMFERSYNEIDNLTTDRSFKNTTLAAMIWSAPQYLVKCEQKSVEAFLSILMKDDQLLLDTENLLPMFTLLTELFKMGHYETFDWVLTRVNDQEDSLKQMLGDFFFREYQFELAIDYYGYLLEKKKLNSTGYENLSRLYRMYGEIEESNKFLKEAIDQNPQKIILYTTYCLHSRNNSDKINMKKQLLDRFPQHQGLPFISSL